MAMVVSIQVLVEQAAAETSSHLPKWAHCLAQFLPVQLTMCGTGVGSQMILRLLK
jgi:hypothetical protein